MLSGISLQLDVADESYTSVQFVGLKVFNFPLLMVFPLINTVSPLGKKNKLLQNPINQKLYFLLMVVFIFVGKEFSLADESKYCEFIKLVTEEITLLKETYPQLKEFSIDKHVDIKNLKVDYRYHTHESERTGGWTSSVPNPYSDGIWFYIDLHNKNSTAQIHTQPISGTSFKYGNKNICFLILEGSETKSISVEIISIFERNGVKPEKP